MKGLRLLFGGLFWLYFGTGCKPAVTTYDQHASTDIADSKTHGFFVAGYRAPAVPYHWFFVAQAWVERAWRYKSYDNKVVRFPTGGYQLNLKIVAPRDTAFSIAGYPWRWQLYDDNDHQHLFWKRDNIFCLDLEDSVVPEAVCVSIARGGGGAGGGGGRGRAGEFEVFRKESNGEGCEKSFGLMMDVAAAKVKYEESRYLHDSTVRQDWGRYVALVREFKSVGRGACLLELLRDSSSMGDDEGVLLSYVPPVSSHFGPCGYLSYPQYIRLLLANLADRDDSVIVCDPGFR